jgi:hypothetical protein
MFFRGFFDFEERCQKRDIYWIEINNMTLEQLFKKIDFMVDYELTLENVTSFVLTIS